MSALMISRERDALKEVNAELLEALKEIPMDCPHTWPHLQACWVCKAKAAIQKAEGVQ